MTTLETSYQINHWLNHYTNVLGLSGRVKRGKDCKGNHAGYAKIKSGTLCFNVEMLAANNDPEEIKNVVGHEICHIAAFDNRPSYEGPHGRTWQMYMQSINLEPKRCHDMAVPNAQKQKRTYFIYTCPNDQAVYLLGKKRHINHIYYGANYLCRECSTRLVFSGKTQKGK
jgi:predicted SprT family Zn-dependent metalloprotease